MAVFRVADGKSALESIARRLEGRKADLARLTEKENPPQALEGAWEGYVASPNRPDTGPDTLAVYRGQFGQFQSWLKEKYPGRLLLKDVTPDQRGADHPPNGTGAGQRAVRRVPLNEDMSR